MYICSVKVAALTMVGPLAIILLLFLLRGRVAKGVGWLKVRIPKETGFLIAPVVASLSFALCWAPIHHQVEDDSGFVSQRTFPAIVGLFAFVLARFGPFLQPALAARGFYEWRDKIPKMFRWVIAILIPLTVSLVITFQERVTSTSLKEQTVVLLALCTGYLAITPRQGSLAAGFRQTTSRKSNV